MTADLVPAEAARLAELEAVVTDGLNTFVTVGRALAEIRDGRLYRATHGTFEDYCQEQWNLSRPRAYELISASEIAGRVSEISDIAPTREGQAKELRGLPAETAAAVMQRAHIDTDGKVTASAIRTAREDLAPRPARRPDSAPLADGFATYLADADAGFREQARTPDLPPEPSPAVTAWLDSSQDVQNSGYLREFFKTFARADDFLQFTAERLGPLIDQGEFESLEMYAVSVSRFVDTVRRSRTGLRVINGGN